ncbi:hypothetical protein TSOC_004689, partial [Tetrabaena socialis]
GYEDVGGPPPASWVLDVDLVRGTAVRGGALAERVSAEGVMLQYAVDSKLDELLATAWQFVTDPPMPLNPYPKLMHLLRSRAVKMELWHDDPEDALSSYLLNELTLVRPPAFIYAAYPPPAAAVRRRAGGPAGGGGGGGGGGEEEVSELVGYGSYAAAAMVDVRALNALRQALGLVLADRHWQWGAYQGEVVPALVGDMAVSNALRLDRDVMAVGAVAGGTGGTGRIWAINRYTHAPSHRPWIELGRLGINPESH